MLFGRAGRNDDRVMRFRNASTSSVRHLAKKDRGGFHAREYKIRGTCLSYDMKAVKAMELRRTSSKSGHKRLPAGRRAAGSLRAAAA